MKLHHRNSALSLVLRSTVVLSTVFLSSMVATAALAADGVRQSPEGDGRVTIGKPHRFADVLLDTDRFTGTYTITPNPADLGKTARLFVAAKVDQRWFANTGGKWVEWNGNVQSLPAFATRVLGQSEQVDFATDIPLAAGSYSVFAGYQVGNGALVYNQKPLQFSVSAQGADGLLPFASDAGMEAYLKQGMQNGVGRGGPQVIMTATGSPASPSADSGKSADSRTSSTNLQEAGVDEADTIKVDGTTLYLLGNCDDVPCLQAHALDSANAKAAPLGDYRFDGKSAAPAGMYLVDHGILGQKMMVTVSGQNDYARGWMTIWGWGDSKTRLDFLNLAAPNAINRFEQLTLDGALVASRRVGSTLYVVTRYSPALDGFKPFPYDKADAAGNDKAMAAARLTDVVPKITDSRKNVESLVQSKDCYLPVSAVDGNSDPSIITITAIPLDNPLRHSSSCFLGGSETLYMSPQALYLATTRWHYDYPTLAAGNFAYSPDHTTALHKFALVDGKVAYRGSAEVKGHLGWDEDKKSFRLGEHNGYLNVVTSIGETWAGNSSTSLTVLKEGAGNTLQTVKTLDGIGLKGERLYASRFVGDRAYLVTFRVTDPLYVVDLANQEQPRIAGELKISGYSDYLHPVSDTLLLGIGKDAVPDTRSGDEGGRGAWYQGVKLSLFDVSDIAAPREINSVVLGKRGTDSDALWDHHAVSFLPATGNEPARLAIPVRLHEVVPTWDGFKATDPSAWYDYTHTALYSFAIDKQGITKFGRLIGEVAQPVDKVPVIGTADATTKMATGVSLLPGTGFAPIYRAYYNDRSVLIDDAVFYVHGGKILASKWGESK